MGFFKRRVAACKPNGPRPAKQTTTPQGPLGHSGPDVFDFHEGFITSGDDNIGRHSPASGTAVVEIYSVNGTLMALDVFQVAGPAPSGPWTPLAGNPATYVVPGDTNRGHQEFGFRLDGPHPLKLPEHLAAKTTIGGVTAKVWWSCT